MNQFSLYDLTVILQRSAGELVTALGGLGGSAVNGRKWTLVDVADSDLDVAPAVREALDGADELAEVWPLCGRPPQFEFRLMAERMRNGYGGGPRSWRALSSQTPAICFFAILDHLERDLNDFEKASVLNEIQAVRKKFEALLEKEQNDGA